MVLVKYLGFVLLSLSHLPAPPPPLHHFTPWENSSTFTHILHRNFLRFTPRFLSIDSKTVFYSRSDRPGLCLFFCLSSCIVSQQSWFWAFLFHKFLTFTYSPRRTEFSAQPAIFAMRLESVTPPPDLVQTSWPTQQWSVMIVGGGGVWLEPLFLGTDICFRGGGSCCVKKKFTFVFVCWAPLKKTYLSGNVLLFVNRASLRF